MNPNQSKHKLKNQTGLALIEIMIAMLIGLILVGGVMQMLSSSRQTQRVHDATARMQESGRMALEIMSRDIRMADFWGCASTVSRVTNNLDAGGVGYIDFGAGGIGGDDDGINPDSLILRGGYATGLGIEPPYGPLPSAQLQVATPNDLEQGDIIFVSDCASADVFQISNADPGTSGALVHNTGAVTEPGNYNATNPLCVGAVAHCLSKVYAADATVFKVQEITYTIAAGSEGEPALFRNDQEFLDGVEDLQVLYGEDTDNDSVANYFVEANNVVDMLQVVSIRFAIVTRSQNDNLSGGVAQNYSVLGDARVGPDERIRQTYMSTVTVRNRM